MTTTRRPVIAGLGITEPTRAPGLTGTGLAAEAVRRALTDAGLTIHDVDGLLVTPGVTGELNRTLASVLSLRDLSLLAEIYTSGVSAVAQVQYAAMAVSSGMAKVVVCVLGDAPLQGSAPGGDAHALATQGATGFASLPLASGMAGPKSSYAMAARRHMHAYGTTSEQLGAVAVAARQWAQRNPIAQMRGPMTLADHQASRMVSEPFRLLDCCLMTNGAAAVIVTSADRAQDLAQPAVHVLGWAQTHPGYTRGRGSEWGLTSGATVSGPAALAMADVTLNDVDVVQLYDCFTFATLITLEDYGFCAKGEGGDFVASGAIAPGGSLPLNTGGGQLSGYYLWGMTPLIEGLLQARGHAGERQAEHHDVVLVSGNGGILDHHGTLILASGPTS